MQGNEKKKNYVFPVSLVDCKMVQSYWNRKSLCLIKRNTGLQYDATFIRQMKTLVHIIMFVYVCSSCIYHKEETEAIQVDLRGYIINCSKSMQYCTVILIKRKGEDDTEKLIDGIKT